jgi:hypothetical protein
MVMRAVEYVGNRCNPVVCEMIFRKSNVSSVVVDPEYGDPIMVEYRRDLSATVLYFTDIAGERHEVMLAQVP